MISEVHYSNVFDFGEVMLKVAPTIENSDNLLSCKITQSIICKLQSEVQISAYICMQTSMKKLFMNSALLLTVLNFHRLVLFVDPHRMSQK